MCIIFYKIIHQMTKEFTILGYEMEKISIFFGLFLLFWGIVISALSQSDSITSYIPSFFGLPLILFGFLSLRLPSKKTFNAYCRPIWVNHFLRRVGCFKKFSRYIFKFLGRPFKNYACSDRIYLYLSQY